MLIFSKKITIIRDQSTAANRLKHGSISGTFVTFMKP